MRYEINNTVRTAGDAAPSNFIVVIQLKKLIGKMKDEKYDTELEWESNIQSKRGQARQTTHPAAVVAERPEMDPSGAD